MFDSMFNEIKYFCFELGKFRTLNVLQFKIVSHKRTKCKIIRVRSV